MNEKNVLEEPVFACEPGWTSYESPFGISLEPGFVSNIAGHKGLRTKYFIRVHDNRLVGKVWFGPLTKGPPGHAHGGSIAAVLDDCMGCAAWIGGKTAVAANINITFRNMVPLGVEMFCEAAIVSVEGRKVTTSGKIFFKDGTLCAEGQGLFIELTGEKIKQLQHS